MKERTKEYRRAKEEATKLILHGLSPKQVMQKFPILNQRAVSQLRQDLGVGPWGRKPVGFFDGVKERLANGETCSEIARDLNVRSQAVYKALYPHKEHARRKARYAIRKGVLIRSEICQQCSQKGFTQAHHEDYSKPLDVTWLCEKCHGGVSGKARRKS